MKSRLNKILLICGAVLISSCGSILVNTNPYWEGEIGLIDGTVKTGYIMVPYSSTEKNIAFKPSLAGEKEMVQRKLIETVRVISENGKRYLYENVPTGKTNKDDASQKKSLFLVVAKNDYTTFYVVSEVYKVNKKNNEISIVDTYVQSRELPLFSYYIRKRGTLKANLFALTGQGSWIGLNSRLKKSAKNHLTEDEDLVQKIANGELKHHDTPEIIRLFMETTKEM